MMAATTMHGQTQTTRTTLCAPPILTLNCSLLLQCSRGSALLDALGLGGAALWQQDLPKNYMALSTSCTCTSGTWTIHVITTDHVTASDRNLACNRAAGTASFTPRAYSASCLMIS